MKQLTKFISNESGSVLLIGVLILALVTIIGLAAVNMGSVEIQISGNDKFHQTAFYNAEGAYQAVFPVFDAIRNGQDTTAFGSTTFASFTFVGGSDNFWAEGYNDADTVETNPDVTVPLLKNSVLDIDRTESDKAGESLINRAGYEGLGKGAAGNWVAGYYVKVLGKADYGAVTEIEVNAAAVR